MQLRATSVASVGISVLVAAATLVAGDSASAAPGATTQYGGGSAAAPVVVVRGLNNPREISLLPFGGMLVAEAGAGGSQCISFGEGRGESCLGMTGSVSWVPFPAVQRASSPLRVITGLISLAAPDGSAATGMSGLSARSFDDVYFVLTGRPPVDLPAGLDTSMMGQLMHSRLRGAPRPAANLQAFEVAHDPDLQGPESAPYSVLALPDRVLIADAAGNDILQLRHGQLSTFAVLPNVPDGGCAGQPNEAGTTGCDAVPTGMAAGRDGSIYVGGLSGLTPGAGRVYQLDGRTGQVRRQWGGLTAVNGVAVGPDGSVYASQLFTAFGPTGLDFTTGKVTRFKPDGTRTDLAVPAPAGLVVSGHDLYVSAWSTSPATGAGVAGTDSSGQVWRLRI